MYTGYYSQLKKYLADGLYPVSIAGKCPDWYACGAWEYADVDHIVEFPDDNTIYLAADFDFHEHDPYDGKVKAKYTDVSDALKGKWAKKFELPYCDDPECDEEAEEAEIKAIEEKTKQDVLDFYKKIVQLV